MRKSFIVMSCLLFVAIISGCGMKQQAVETNSSVNSGGAASLVKYYNTIEELTGDAKEILEIKVKDQETITYGDLPFTISTVDVESSYKGTHQKGDTVRIIETGGEYTPLDKQGKPFPKTNFKFNGIPVLGENEHAVVFLDKFVGPQVEGEVYVPLGVYQGKFKVDESTGELIQQAPDTEKIKGYEKTKLDKFSELINKGKQDNN
ncbi:hypothetical protein [Cohnella mopanensis]|uniref:hypothetical protein n=1 Tax=Cohnella mopanensis TaxID=2911966 RepID=UPI001EF889C4|nr:hypothetical protein [Cohnella mopanensis]